MISLVESSFYLIGQRVKPRKKIANMAMDKDKSEIAEIIKASVDTYADLQSSDGHKYTVYNISVTDSGEHGNFDNLSENMYTLPHHLQNSSFCYIYVINSPCSSKTIQ